HYAVPDGSLLQPGARVHPDPGCDERAVLPGYPVVYEIDRLCQRTTVFIRPAEQEAPKRPDAGSRENVSSMMDLLFGKILAQSGQRHIGGGLRGDDRRGDAGLLHEPDLLPGEPLGRQRGDAKPCPQAPPEDLLQQGLQIPLGLIEDAVHEFEFPGAGSGHSPENLLDDGTGLPEPPGPSFYLGIGTVQAAIRAPPLPLDRNNRFQPEVVPGIHPALQLRHDDLAIRLARATCVRTRPASGDQTRNAGLLRIRCREEERDPLFPGANQGKLKIQVAQDLLRHDAHGRAAYQNAGPAALLYEVGDLLYFGQERPG